MTYTNCTHKINVHRHTSLESFVVIIAPGHSWCMETNESQIAGTDGSGAAQMAAAPAAQTADEPQTDDGITLYHTPSLSRSQPRQGARAHCRHSRKNDAIITLLPYHSPCCMCEVCDTIEHRTSWYAITPPAYHPPRLLTANTLN